MLLHLDAWEQDNGPHIISALLKTGRVTDVANKKAYEILSNYVGLIKLYQLTGDPKFLKTVEMAWQDIEKNQLYITGTTSEHEHFKEDGILPAQANSNMGEGCVRTTWIQLNQNLFAITGDNKYLNQLEKSVYNHLLGAQNPATGCVSYYTPLMNQKTYTCNITCCQSSIPRGIALVPNFTFGNRNNTPTVLFYEPAIYKERIKTIGNKKIEASFKLDGNFPESGNLTLSAQPSMVSKFSISLRVPVWSTNFVAKIDGKDYSAKTNGFITITKVWKPGDKINISFDMPIEQISGEKSYPNQIAFQRGPQILAFDQAINSENAFNLITNTNQNSPIKTINTENISSVLPKNWIGKQAYSIELLNKAEKIFLVPFAEASQTAAEMRVWLPLKIAEK